MQVVSGHVTSHRSRNESSSVRVRGNRDGDKLLCNMKNKCHNLKLHIKKFHRKFNSLHVKGFQGLHGIGDKLIPRGEYQQRLHDIAIDKAKFVKIKGTIT